MKLPTPARHLLREPLLHFLLLGALVFAADHYLHLNRPDSLVIEIPVDVRKEAHDGYLSSTGHEPTPHDMQVLLQRWVDNEVLYREGLAMGIDRGDSNIRDRVIFKTFNVTQSGVTLPRPDDAELRTWFAHHRADYDEPARFDFFEAVVAGKTARPALEAMAAALNGQGQPAQDSSLQVFRGRPRWTVVQGYGEAFTHQLEQLKPGTWTVLDSSTGAHLIRLDTIVPGRAADFEALRDNVTEAWKNSVMSERSTRAVREMAKRYTIRGLEAGV